MPAARRLSTLIRSGTPVAEEVRQIARMLAAFHVTTRRGPQISIQGTRDALPGRWDAAGSEASPN